MPLNASLVGAKTVMLSALFNVSTRPAPLTALTRVLSRGLLLAAVATGSLDMPSNDPLPEVGTAEQPGPNGWLAVEADGESIGVVAGELIAGLLGALEAAGAEPASAVPPHAASVIGKA